MLTGTRFQKLTKIGKTPSSHRRIANHKIAKDILTSILNGVDGDITLRRKQKIRQLHNERKKKLRSRKLLRQLHHCLIVLLCYVTSLHGGVITFKEVGMKNMYLLKRKIPSFYNCFLPLSKVKMGAVHQNRFNILNRNGVRTMLTKVRYVLFQKPCLAFQLIPPQITWEDHWDINETQAGPYAHAVAHQHSNEEEPIKA